MVYENFVPVTTYQGFKMWFLKSLVNSDLFCMNEEQFLYILFASTLKVKV